MGAEVRHGCLEVRSTAVTHTANKPFRPQTHFILLHYYGSALYLYKDVQDFVYLCVEGEEGKCE